MTRWNSVCACVMAVALAACGSSSPSSPSPSPAPAPAPAPAPTLTAAVSVAYTPNPVPYAGAGLTTCLGFANSWRFTATLTETGGVAVTITSVVATLDGVAQPPVAVSIAVAARGSNALPLEVCFPAATQHTLVQALSGVDSQGRAVTFTGGTVTLAARP